MQICSREMQSPLIWENKQTVKGSLYKLHIYAMHTCRCITMKLTQFSGEEHYESILMLWKVAFIDMKGIVSVFMAPSYWFEFCHWINSQELINQIYHWKKVLISLSRHSEMYFGNQYPKVMTFASHGKSLKQSVAVALVSQFPYFTLSFSTV